ncbi:STAS domain-containing protein [Phytohabitans sp. LJ34]|uniref:STAS domain-containing protein n=1 Tax=Phytohabitans sp. LJ34 TaxID=3452217 RepID=UPI003F8BC7A6
MAPTLSCDVRRQADAVVIVARGELDMNTSATLESAANQALRPVPIRLVLDCSQLTFCDSMGMSLLVRLSFHVEEVGSRLVIDRPSLQLRRLLTLTGLDTVLDLQPDHDTAAHQASPTDRCPTASG